MNGRNKCTIQPSNKRNENKIYKSVIDKPPKHCKHNDAFNGQSLAQKNTWTAMDL